MRNFIVSVAVLGLATLGPALASSNDASACSPPQKPGVAPPRAQGIHSVQVSVSGRLPRDGGILMVADVESVDISTLLSKVTVKVSAGGAPIAGELRAFAVEDQSPLRLTLQFLPTGGLLPATTELHAELAYEQAAGAAEAPKTFDGEVDNVLLTDLALPEMSLSLLAPELHADGNSPPVRCILKEPKTLSSRGGCGGQGEDATLTETTFPSKQLREQAAKLNVAGRYNYGVERYVTYKSRVNWPGDPAGWDIGYFSDNYSFQIPEAAKGEVCFEVVADSKVLTGFPKTVKACQPLPTPAPITADEDKAYFDEQLAPCRDAIAPAGTTLPATSNASADSSDGGSDGGCSVQGTGHATTGASFGAFLLGLVLLGRRRRPQN